MKLVSFAGTILVALAFGAATAVLAVLGAHDGLTGHPLVAWLLGATVALGLAGPIVASAVARIQRRRTLALSQYLAWFATSIRESIYQGSIQASSSEVGALGLRDVGVHIYVKRRQAILFRRFDYVRYARSATANRSPNPDHGVFRDKGIHAPAQGLPGITIRSFCRPRIDLMDSDHKAITDAEEGRQASVAGASITWQRWYEHSDPRALGSDWKKGAAARRNFSAIWAEPVPTFDGERVACITVNVEREIENGSELLSKAGADEILRSFARVLGLGIVNFVRF